MGINFYFGIQLSGRTEDGDVVDHSGAPVSRHMLQPGRPRTAMGWEIMPDDFAALLQRVGREYPGVPLYVTENGAAFADRPDEHDYVHDLDRTGYVADQIAAVAIARSGGADARGYFVWSLDPPRPRAVAARKTSAGRCRSGHTYAPAEVSRRPGHTRGSKQV